MWTAHNVLPHAPVFADDAAARRVLVATSSLVLVHSPSALAGLATLGAVPSRSAVIPHGPLAPVLPGGSMRAPGTGSGPRQVLFFGKILEYKGVEDLLAAFTGLPTSAGVRLVVAGQCDDPATRARLSALAQASHKPVVLRASSAFPTRTWPHSSNQLMSSPSPIDASPRADAPCWHWPTGGP